MTYWNEDAFGWGNKETDYEAKILGQADRAIGIAPDTLFAYTTKSQYLSHVRPGERRAPRRRRPDRDQSKLRLGICLSWSSPRLFLGQFEQAKSDLQQPMRLSPRDPRMGWFHDFMARCRTRPRTFRRCDRRRQQGDRRRIQGLLALPNLATAHVLKGEIDEAKTALTEARRLNPKLSVKWLLERGYAQPLIDALRKAGLPEE